MFFLFCFWGRLVKKRVLKKLLLKKRSAFNFVEKETLRCFLVNFAKFLRTSFLKKQLRWLLFLHFLSSSLCYVFMYENVQIKIKGKALRSSPSQMFFKTAVLKYFAILARKHLCWRIFSIKSQA